MARRKYSTEGVTERADDWGMNIPWYRLMAVSIIQRAWLDLSSLNDMGKDTGRVCNEVVWRDEVEAFLNSRWCALLLCGADGAGITGEYIKEIAR